ncbi:iron transporter [Deltaproteobacteria bacterium]|nr:iron transporter [Deltaproteobacteria bacterium]
MTSPHTIDTMPTPNPDALMFKVPETLIPVGTYEFKSAAQASDAPLPRRIFDIAGVLSVLVAPRFVTVNKDSESPWPLLVPAVKDAIRDFLDSGDMAVPEEGLPLHTPVDELSRKVLALLDEFIRPAIAQDGGDIVFHGIEDGVVLVKLIGACGTCPSSTATLAMGVERMLLEELPELRGVRQVAD